MKKFLIVRIVKAIFTIWFVVTLVFVLTRVSGDPTYWILSDEAPVEVRLELRESLGLNRPIHQQYFETFANVWRGDVGESYYFRRPVNELFAQRAGATLSLGVTAFVLSVVLGIPLGGFAAVKRNSFSDRFSMSVATVVDAIPGFVFAIIMIFIFSLKLHWFPSGGSGSLLNYIMPVVTLAVGPMANIARLTRSSLLDVLKQDYLDCARAKGVLEYKIIYKHALRNALIPVATIVGLQMGFIISGSVVVETVFAWPGIGSLLVTAASTRDFPVVQYGVLVISVAVTLTNALVDLSYAFLDPRIRDNF